MTNAWKTLAAAVFSFGVVSSVFANTELTVYTAMENEQLAGYKKAFEAKYPDIEIKWVRDSTGIITAKLLAEKDNPRADVIWGLYASSVALMGKEGMLEAYAPAGLDKVDSKFRDTRNPPLWVGNGVEATAICVNAAEAKKQNLPIPTSWEDLTKPVYKGKIVMPNPASSGTGYSAVNAWLQIMGEDKGWAFMDKLHVNIGQYTHSGSKPCTQAAMGEYPIGISLDFRAVTLKRQGAPLEIVLPTEGLGLDINSVALIKGSKNLDAAKKLEDFAVSDQAFLLYQPNAAALARPEFNVKLKEMPDAYYDRLITVDFDKAGAQRAAVLEKWRARYDGKSEQK
ncbi:putative 2-aminoethylphosphonate ABC transporter substrate-binding protein [Pseudomonas sp. GV071]|jgi:iron(III) transport system substrate-binding protein|uniref:putative 2-aminoethylphosphonate ABC transporter substrate-binding protein n=1 Tax=Pseudomonas sp. GV071 TaxID=2135754 RepID=UPI000D3A9909|nr:putative 2-aminoethylphosphonate ABC transporter substrate-binding protein [Pseudomonas sp. GV071]PTQ66951.1 iron(III) transport system substrate-binding protein [Pseudomonas sp. GV071]